MHIHNRTSDVNNASLKRSRLTSAIINHIFVVFFSGSLISKWKSSIRVEIINPGSVSKSLYFRKFRWMTDFRKIILVMFSVTSRTSCILDIFYACDTWKNWNSIGMTHFRFWNCHSLAKKSNAGPQILQTELF